MSDAVWQIGNAQPRHRCGGKSRAVIRLEPPLWIDGHSLVAIHQVPRFCALHQRLMVD